MHELRSFCALHMPWVTEKYNNHLMHDVCEILAKIVDYKIDQNELAWIVMDDILSLLKAKLERGESLEEVN